MSEVLSSAAGPSTDQADIEKTKPLAGHLAMILAICYSPDGREIVTAGRNPLIRVWDSDTGEMVSELQACSEPYAVSMCFSPDREKLVVGDLDGRICTRSTSDGRIMVEHPFPEHIKARPPVIWAVAYSPDSRFIANGESRGRVRLWHAEDMTLIMEIPQHPATVRSIDFSPDSRWLATGCDNCEIRIFDVATGMLTVGPLEGHTRGVHAVTYRPDGQQLASCSEDCTIRIWDASTGTMLLDPLEGHSHTATCIIYSPDGKKLLSGSIDQSIRLWDADIGKLIGGPMRGHDIEIRVVDFAPDETRFVTGAHDGSMRLWDTCTQEILLPGLTDDEKDRYNLTGPFRGHTASIFAVAYFPDGERVASASYDGSIRIWDAHTGKLLVGPIISPKVSSIAVSSDGRRLVGLARYPTFWDTRTGDIMLEVRQLDLSSPFHSPCVQFSPDDQFVAISSSRGVSLLDSETGELLRSMSDRSDIESLCFSPDGSRLAGGGGDKCIFVWDVLTAEMVAGPFQGHTGTVWSVAFSPDGRQIVSGSMDKTLRVWDAKTGAIAIGPLEAHSGSVWSVSYSPDGTRICSAFSNGTIYLWHAATGELVLGPLDRHKRSINSVAFSPDGKRIITGSLHSIIQFWNASTGEIVQFPDTPPDQSFLDLPATGVPSHSQRVQEIILGSPIDVQNISVALSGPSQDNHSVPTTLSPFARLRNTIANIFSTSRQPTQDAVELAGRHPRSLRPVRVANAEAMTLVAVAATGSSPPREQITRIVSDDGSSDDADRSGGQRVNDDGNIGTPADKDANASGTQQRQGTSNATEQTRQGGEHGRLLMERSTPYSAAPGIGFATESVESEDSFEVDCCACCPSWCTCLHP